jgi:hypothetical protein
MKFVAAIAALTLAASPALPQPAATPRPDSRAIIAEHMLAIAEMPDGGYSGPGWERLLADADAAQFFMLGEQHGTRDIARFATRLQGVLARRGYEHMAMEVGPWSLDFAERLIRSGRGRLADYIRQPGHGFTLPFLFFREEIDLAEQAVASPPDRVHALWGVDQEFVGSGPIAVALLRGWARTRAERAAVAAFAAQVEGNPLLAGTMTAAQLDALATAFRGSGPASALIGELRGSGEIYAPFMRRGGPTFPANLARETLIKRNFLRHFAETERRLGAPPRVFLKFGGNHAMRGFSGTDVPGFADFIAEWGLSRGFTLVNMMVDCAGGQALDPQSNRPEPCEPYFGADTAFGSMPRSERLTLVDLKALRPLLPRMTNLDAASRRTILAFDYYLVIRDVHAATPTATAAPALGR